MNSSRNWSFELTHYACAACNHPHAVITGDFVKMPDPGVIMCKDGAACRDRQIMQGQDERIYITPRRASRARRIEHAATRATELWLAYRKRHYAMWDDPSFTADQLRASMRVYHHYYERMRRLNDAWRAEMPL